MKEITDISYWSLFSGYLFLIVPVFILWYYKTGLVKDTLWAMIRMTVQLLLTGVYLEYIFNLDNRLLNIAWVLMMTSVASYTIIRRSELSFRMFILPVLISGIFSIAVTDAFFLGFVIKLDNVFAAQYFIPITGMLLGNTIKTIIVALSSYYGRLKTETDFYRWHLANGASMQEALLVFRQDAFKKAFNPIIAGTAIVGLIALPGMMTGQILGGNSPAVAIKYQIMLMITIFSSSIISVVLTIIISDRYVFDDFNNLKAGISKK